MSRLHRVDPSSSLGVSTGHSKESVKLMFDVFEVAQTEEAPLTEGGSCRFDSCSRISTFIRAIV
jgi:hypothetical protein